MKKRIFLPLTISHILTILIPGSMLIVCVIGLVFSYIDSSAEVEGIALIGYYLGIPFLSYSTIRLVLAPKVSLRNDYIYKNGDGLTKVDKIQYRCKVYYKDINNIEIVASTNNSKNQSVLNAAIIKYLEFTLQDGQKERMIINFYRKKQIIKMLNMIKYNMQVVGNNAELDIDKIMESWYSVGGYNNKNVIQK